MLSMDDKREATIQRLGRISRRVTLAYLGLALAGLLLTRAGVAWAVVAGSVLLAIAAVTFCVSWFMPSILVLRRTPWYALAWLEGANPFIRPRTRWEHLSDWSRLMVALISFLLGGFMLVVIFNIAVEVIR